MPLLGRPGVAQFSGRHNRVWQGVLWLLFFYSPVAWSVSSELSVVAPGVYALIGDAGEISPQNRGAVGNAGFIIGDRGVVVVDTGISYRYGKAMLATIAGVTPLPVELAIISHPIQEFLFGAAAFQERHIPILAHEKTAELMRNRCAVCLKNLRRLLGEEEMRGSSVVVPDRLVEQSLRLSLGGRDVELLHYGWASTPGDLAVFDRASGVLFAGGLVSVGRIPELRDADLRGWISALQQLEKLPIKWVIPGHGPVSTAQQMTQTLNYLTALEAKVRALYKKGVGLTDTIAQAQLPDFASWNLYSVIHPQNVQHVYLRLENEDFN
jgi:glyoxylase-like metal-dependent hydrolase (beta-lactamase superfamily II)